MNMFIMLHIHDLFFGGSMFHCSFTGARLWKRTTFLLGLGKAISESLSGALAVRYGFYVNFSARVINMLTCKQSVFGVGLYTKVGL